MKINPNGVAAADGTFSSIREINREPRIIHPVYRMGTGGDGFRLRQLLDSGALLQRPNGHLEVRVGHDASDGSCAGIIRTAPGNNGCISNAKV